MIRGLARGCLVVIGAAALLLAAPVEAMAGGTCHEPPTNGRGVTVEMTEVCFASTILRTGTGTEVTFVNRDPLPHTVTGVGWGSFKEIGEGESLTLRFSKPGVYAYTCVVHPGMSGAIVVGDGAGPGAGGKEVKVEPVTPTELGLDNAIGTAESDRDTEGSLPWAGIAAAAVAAGAGFGFGRARRTPTR